MATKVTRVSSIEVTLEASCHVTRTSSVIHAITVPSFCHDCSSQVHLSGNGRRMPGSRWQQSRYGVKRWTSADCRDYKIHYRKGHYDKGTTSELSSCVKVEVDVLGSPPLTVLMVSVDVKQQ